MQFHHPKIFNMIIAFFRLFFKDEKCRQKHAEFRNELCVFLFALSIGRFRWILENILMRSCLLQVLFLVDLVGLEPMTSALRTQRSPN